jgi:hypothetical protein
MPRPLTWRACYNDGSSLPQISPDGGENRYADIDRSRLTTFALEDGRGERVFALHLDRGQRLIYRRRFFVREQSGERVVFHLVGWQWWTDEQLNAQAITYVPEDPAWPVQMAGRFREEHPLFHGIVPHPHEGEI